MSWEAHHSHVRCHACGAWVAALGVGAAVFCGCGVALANPADPSDQPGTQTSTSVSVEAFGRAGPRATPAAAADVGPAAAQRSDTAERASAASRDSVSHRNTAPTAASRTTRASTALGADQPQSGIGTSPSPAAPADVTDAPAVSPSAANSAAAQVFYAPAPATATVVGAPGVGGTAVPPATPAVPSVLLSTVSLAGRNLELLAAAAVLQPLRRAATLKTVTASALTTTTNVPIEGETFRLAPVNSGSVFSDKNASGGRALLMSTNGTASTTVTTPAFSSLVIRAKGDQYKGAPTMVVSVDGKVVSTVAVPATGWTDYTIPVTGTAGTHTISVGYVNDLRASAGKDRNLRVDKLTVVATVVTPPPPPSTTAPYFQSADWLWKPIGANPTLAANSATWVGYFSAPGTQHVAELHQEGTTLVRGTSVTSSTPRYDITFSKPWGPDPFATYTVPIPVGTQVPYQGGDAHLAVQDPVTGQVFGLWQANYNPTTNKWTASWGGMTPMTGNGIDTSGSATATGISRYAGVVTADEMTAAIAANTGVNHALVFATDIAGPTFVGPAIKSDGDNPAGVATPIPEGYRVQLDPSINVDALPGLTPGEKVIAKTLQTHGAYVVDKGGARMAFAFETLPDSTNAYPGKTWTDAGFAWDYYDMSHIPWSSLRVLAV